MSFLTLFSGWTGLLFCVLGLTAHLAYNKYGYGISTIPGPLLASYTDLWRFFLVWNRRPEVAHISLHQKHGLLVRLGPNSVSVSDPEAIKVIYGIGSSHTKSGFYPVQQAVTREGHRLEGIFNTTDEVYHARLRKAVSNAYAMSTLVQFEPFVDSTTAEFLKQLTIRFANAPNKICDFGVWLQYYAFDVIGELTFSKRLGFVERGVDVDDIISSIDGMLGYFSLIGQIPSFDKFLLKNPIRLWLSRHGWINATSPIAVFAQGLMKQRQNAPSKATNEDQKRDFLSRFMEAGEKDPTFMHPGRILSLTAANMFAGSDTTAVSLRAIFYLLLKNPDTLRRLRAELDEAERDGLFSRSDKLVRWNEAQQLPYLAAVIKEALRVHPAGGLPLERIVPSGGVVLAGRFIPAGTVVGCNAWVIHLNQSIFGKDAAAFNPERWLETPEKVAEMNQVSLTFGGGVRTCIGKNISFLEMYKLVPAVLRTFEINLVDPKADWHLDNKWFVKQSRIFVRLTTRNRQADC